MALSICLKLFKPQSLVFSFFLFLEKFGRFTFRHFLMLRETEFHRDFACAQYTLKSVACYTAFHRIALKRMMYFTYHTRYST